MVVHFVPHIFALFVVRSPRSHRFTLHVYIWFPFTFILPTFTRCISFTFLCLYRLDFAFTTTTFILHFARLRSPPPPHIYVRLHLPPLHLPLHFTIYGSRSFFTRFGSRLFYVHYGYRLRSFYTHIHIRSVRWIPVLAFFCSLLLHAFQLQFYTGLRSILPVYVLITLPYVYVFTPPQFCHTTPPHFSFTRFDTYISHSDSPPHRYIFSLRSYTTHVTTHTFTYTGSHTHVQFRVASTFTHTTHHPRTPPPRTRTYTVWLLLHVPFYVTFGSPFRVYRSSRYTVHAFSQFYTFPPHP